MLKVNCNCDDSDRIIKNIYVFVNGEKYTGLKIVLNQNRWHHILNEITLKLDPYFGKVEKLYTTSSGLTVCSFTDLENNGTYVASNRVQKYANVQGGYSFVTERTQEYFEHYLSSQLQRMNKNKKLVYVRRDLLVIYIFRNGECGQSFKIVLTSEDLSSWSHILSYIALILDIPERCIKSLYSVNGNKICGPWELQHGASYVAVGYNQSFKRGCYHVDQKSTEVLTTGFPVVAKDKNLTCTHRIRRKMKQNLSWNHYDQYTCVNPPTGNSSRKSRTSSKKSKPTSSQSYSPDFENYREDEMNGRMSKNMPLENENMRNSSYKNRNPRNLPFENEKSRNPTFEYEKSGNPTFEYGKSGNPTFENGKLKNSSFENGNWRNSSFENGKPKKLSFENEIPRNAHLNNRTLNDMTLGYATLENNALANGSSKNSVSENGAPKKSKKVTVHMRIKNTAASNLTITRNAGDTSPARKKKKKWEDEDSTDSDTSTTLNTNSQLCDCTGETCSTSSHNNKHKQKNKYHSEPTSPGSSETDIPNSKDKKGRNLTWQHVKKSESQLSTDKSEKVSVHIRGGKAVVIGGDDDDDSLNAKKAEKSKEKKKNEKKEKKKEEKKQKKQAEAEKKAKAKEDKLKKNCAPNCGEEDDCRFYTIAKPTMDKYKSLFCPNASSNTKPQPKPYNSILKHRDTSESRLKNRNSVIECKESAKCKATLKRQSFLKKMSKLLNCKSSKDISKRRRQKKTEMPDTDSEDSSDNSSCEYDSLTHNLSSCTICRIQQERRQLIKKYK